MYSFYKKHEVLSAVLLIILYCAGTILFSSDGSVIWSILYLAAVSAFLTLFIIKGGLSKEFGFFWPPDSRKYLYFIPLWIITTSGLWGGFVPECHGVLLASCIISMLCVGYVEELLFRGFLFKALLKECGFVPAVIVSSVSFGLAHIVNLFTGQATFLTIVQIVYAFAWGFIFTMVFYRSRSLLPCIISHALYDVSGYFNNAGQVLSWIVVGVIIAVSVVYGIWLARLPDSSAAAAGRGTDDSGSASREEN